MHSLMLIKLVVQTSYTASKDRNIKGKSKYNGIKINIWNIILLYTNFGLRNIAKTEISTK